MLNKINLIVLIIVYASLLLSGNLVACEKGEDANYSDALTIVSSSFVIKSVADGNWVTSLGLVKNISEHDLNSLVFEVRYFNLESELIDTATEELYGLVAPTGDEVAFRVQSFAAAPANSYSTHEDTVTSAELKNSCGFMSSKSSRVTSALKQLLIAVAPIALLVLVWILLVRRYGKTKSNKTQIQLIEEQVDNSKELALEVKRIADILSQNADDKASET